jgi:WD40 repeat protein
VRQWDLSTGKLSSIPEAYSEGQISSMCLTAQGWLVTCHGLSGAVRVRELGVERSLHEFEHGLGAVVHAVRASSDGMFAVVAHSHGVTLWDLARGKKLGELERLAGRVDAIGISPDDREIYTGNNDGAIQRWTVEWELQSDPAGGA